VFHESSIDMRLGDDDELTSERGAKGLAQTRHRKMEKVLAKEFVKVYAYLHQGQKHNRILLFLVQRRLSMVWFPLEGCWYPHGTKGGWRVASLVRRFLADPL